MENPKDSIQANTLFDLMNKHVQTKNDIVFQLHQPLLVPPVRFADSARHLPSRVFR